MKFLVINFLCVGAALGAGIPERAFENVLLNYTGRITGGNEVEPHSIPHQGAMFIKAPDGTYFCGCSLLFPNWILTAAHCVEAVKNTPSAVELVFGAHYIRQYESTQVAKFASQIIVHPEYDPVAIINDLALVYVSDPFTYTKEIQPVNLPPIDTSDDFNFQEVTVSGWGKDTDAATTISPCLRSVKLFVIPNLLCYVPFLFSIQDCHLCCSGFVGQSSCSGDSGGALTVLMNGIVTQIGVVSFGIALGCEKGWPSVFTRLTEYLLWIYNIINSPISY